MFKGKKSAISCDLKVRVRGNIEKKTFVEDKSRLYKYKGNFVWQGIKTERYKSGSEGWTDVLRKT
ncbi:MAG: hypothetical protein AB1638_04750, partial [Nitrospirota bacterium]